MKDRIKTLETSFKDEFDAYLVMNEINMLYFSDFLGATALLVPSSDESILYVYDVNYEGAKTEAKNCRVEKVKHGEELFKKVSEQVEDLKLKKIGFDTMNLEMYQKVKKALKNTKLKAKSEYVWNLRRVKSNDELEKMRKAAGLTMLGMQTACETLRPGLHEYQVAAEIEYAMRINGSSGVAFATIVASGPHSAYPHGGRGEREIKDGDVVVVDIGATYKNYRGDMTRTFVIGRPSAKQEKIYNIVKKAQEEAFQKIRDGVKASEPDAVARDVIKNAGYGKYFVHGVGHGVGLEVHELPILSSMSKDVLKAGNVVTDEPGVYIVNFGGFRIEDTVLVQKDNAERLTKGLYTLQC